MIPYVTVPPIFIGTVVVQPFALLVSMGVLVAHLMLVRRAGRIGLERARAAEMSLAMVVCGFAGAVLFKLLYRPDLLASAWSGAGLTALPGISSFGGLFGALAGGAAYLRLRGVSAGERAGYFDAAAFSFPFGFAFGRLGCTITHDHPGLRSDSGWLTVALSGRRAVGSRIARTPISAARVWHFRLARPARAAARILRGRDADRLRNISSRAGSAACGSAAVCWHLGRSMVRRGRGNPRCVFFVALPYRQAAIITFSRETI